MYRRRVTAAARITDAMTGELVPPRTVTPALDALSSPSGLAVSPLTAVARHRRATGRDATQKGKKAGGGARHALPD